MASGNNDSSKAVESATELSVTRINEENEEINASNNNNDGVTDRDVLQVPVMTVVPMNIAVADNIANSDDDRLTDTSSTTNVNT